MAPIAFASRSHGSKSSKPIKFPSTHICVFLALTFYFDGKIKNSCFAKRKNGNLKNGVRLSKKTGKIEECAVVGRKVYAGQELKKHRPEIFSVFFVQVKEDQEFKRHKGKKAEPLICGKVQIF